jgi:hypothetical protein
MAMFGLKKSPSVDQTSQNSQPEINDFWEQVCEDPIVQEESLSRMDQKLG